jgi:tetratricopeptide (TPR) repeat protein
VPKRSRRPIRPEPLPDARPAAGRERGLLLPGLVVVLAVLGGLYVVSARFWGSPPAPKPATPQLISLPTEPTDQTVDELRAEAEGVVQELTEVYTKSPGAHKVASTYYQFLKQYEQAAHHCEEAIALSPTDPVPRGWLAKIRMKEGRDADAMQILATALEDGLGTAEIQHEYAAALQRNGNLPAAAKAAQVGLRRDSRNLDLWIILGQVQLQSGELAAAKESFEKALDLDPNSAAARTAAANVCQQLGNVDEAARHQQLLAEMNGKGEPKTVTFEQTYERSLRNIVATVLSTAATEHLNHGNPTPAEKLCLRAIAIDPTFSDSYRQLANLYHRSERLEDALVVQRRLTAIEPENPTNHANLASLALQSGSMEEGQAVLEEATRNLPQYAVFPHRLALIHLQRKDLAEARRYIEQAIRQEPTPERYQLLSDICRDLGDSSFAEAAVESSRLLQKGGERESFDP